MIAVALALLSLAADPLAAAREAFARADYGSAESLALAAAAPPADGAALYLVGLSRFRSGKPESALEALEQAGAAADPPPPGQWHYNRGACLNELGRFAEAEREFTEAAQLDASLAAVALVNAGFAALDNGFPERARALADRARALGPGAAADQLAELDEHLAAQDGRLAESYRAGLAAFDAGRFAEARAQFQAAAQLDPASGRSLIMSGASAWRLGDDAAAKADLERALSLSLAEDDARAARGYLEAIGRDASARKELSIALRLGGGYDTDALQTGLSGPGELPGSSTAAPSALATTHLSASWSPAPSGSDSIRLAYAFDQLAYLAPGTTDRSLQQHGLTLAVEQKASPALKLGASLLGDFAATGLSNIQGLQLSGGAWLFAALDESERTTTRLDLGYTRKRGLSSYGYLTGDRADAALSQELRLGAVSLDAGGLLRLEDIGTTTQPAPPPPREVCESGCTATAVVPYGYLGGTFWLGLRAAPLPRLSLSLSGGVELRSYLDDGYVKLVMPAGADSVIDRRRRADTRWFGSAAATVQLFGTLSLALRYDLVSSRSNLSGNQLAPPVGLGGCGPPDFECHQFDPSNQNYDKHVITLETAISY